MLLNESATVNPALTKDLIDMWVPRCYRQGLGPACVHSYLFMHTLTGPEDDEDLESAAVSPTFRRAKMHLLPTWYMSLGHEMNYEDRVSFAHDVVGPTLYKYVWCEIFFPRGKYFYAIFPTDTASTLTTASPSTVWTGTRGSKGQ